MPRALVVYATSEGQTAKIAQRLADVMRREGFDVDVAEGPPAEVTPDPYDAVLVGGSIHIGSFQRKLTAWAKTHQATLATKHDAFFGVCMAASSDAPAKQEEAQAYLDTFLAETDWHPDRAIMFAGALRFTQYGLIKRWLMAAIAKHEHMELQDSRHDYEFTNWSNVDAFAHAFARELPLEHPAPM